MATHQKLLRWIAILSLSIFSSGVAADPGQVYLVQASGWMDGYINNTSGDFQRKVARLIELTNAPGWPIAVASFNRHKEAMERGNDCSPRTLFPFESCDERSTLGPWNERGVGEALAQLRIPVSSKGWLANAFLDEALIRAREIHLGSDPNGIVWVVTNNKNAPEGGLPARDVIENSRAFMAKLKSDAGISAVVAVPIAMRAVSPSHPQFGILHGFIAYGREGKQLLEAVTWNADFVAEFGQPFRIRPLDEEPLRLRIAPQTPDDSVQVTIGPDGAIHVAGVEIGRRVPLVLHGTLENTLYPHVIRKAAVSIAWQTEATRPIGELRASVGPATVTDIGPRDTRDVVVTLDFAAVHRPDERSGFKDQVFDEQGNLHLEVTGIELSQDPSALVRLRTVFLGDAVDPAVPATADSLIPDIFLSGAMLARSDGNVPIVFEARVSPIDTVEKVGGVIGVVIIVGLMWLQMRSPRRQSALIAGQRQYFSLRPFQTIRFRAIDGKEYAVRGGVFGEKSARATPVSGGRS